MSNTFLGLVSILLASASAAQLSAVARKEVLTLCREPAKFYSSSSCGSASNKGIHEISIHEGSTIERIPESWTFDAVKVPKGCRLTLYSKDNGPSYTEAHKSHAIVIKGNGTERCMKTLKDFVPVAVEIAHDMDAFQIEEKFNKLERTVESVQAKELLLLNNFNKFKDKVNKGLLRGNVCCKAQTKECLACTADQTIAEFCENNSGKYGCPTKKKICCEAQTKECLACIADQTIAEFCEKKSWKVWLS